ncbi:nucleotidyl transferase AbiEii/AbiGii toxin family protein, partial [Leuconostoc mesenteroides]
QTKDTKIRNNSEKIDYKNGSTKISIDISAGEFTEPRSMKIIDGYAIYIYTTIMIVYEKARASAQQLPEYKHAKEKTRARDLYDILKLLQNHPDLSSQVLDPNN